MDFLSCHVAIDVLSSSDLAVNLLLGRVLPFIFRYMQNPNSLPGALVLLAAEAGDGWVPLGPTAAKAGRKVATVFEDPSIEASDIEIYRTHTHELMIRGTGFNKAARPTLDFEPALDSFDVYVNVSCGVVMHLLICLFYCFGGGGDGVAFVNTVSGVVMGLIRHFCGSDAWEAYLRRETRGFRVKHEPRFSLPWCRKE